MKTKTNGPITLLYRGDLKDTAALVGLIQSRARIDLIAYTGPLEAKNLIYIKIVNKWLKSQGQPLISMQTKLSKRQTEQIPDDPLIEWNWGLAECRAALKMVGLPIPK